LVNGTNKNAAGAGQYSQVKLTKGKRHRLRLINTSMEASIRVSLDGHSFQIISSDFVPVQPIYNDWVLLGIGQRYDVIVTANQTDGNFWFRAEAASDCNSRVLNVGRAIFTYDGTTVADPTTSPFPAPNVCQDEHPLSPWWKTQVPNADFLAQSKVLNVDLERQNVTTNGKNLVLWAVNTSAIDVDWEKPTLQYVLDKNTDYPQVSNLIELPTENIVSLTGIILPFHL
jgi:FtsP/CotA-like multicopper oxidase with cupredoxin domain